MTEALEITIKEQEKDRESGDMYYTIEATLMEPGALFAENQEDIEEKLEEALKDLR